MFTNTRANHPPVRAVIWDLDGMIVQIKASETEMSVSDLESLVQFILVLCQNYRIVVLTRQPAERIVPSDCLERLMLPLESGRSNDYYLALRWLHAQPRQSVVVGVDPQRLVDASRIGIQTVAFHNLRQAVSELLPLLAEPLAV
jgi:hypothetical protein